MFTGPPSAGTQENGLRTADEYKRDQGSRTLTRYMPTRSTISSNTREWSENCWRVQEVQGPRLGPGPLPRLHGTCPPGPPFPATQEYGLRGTRTPTLTWHMFTGPPSGGTQENGLRTADEYKRDQGSHTHVAHAHQVHHLLKHMRMVWEQLTSTRGNRAPARSHGTWHHRRIIYSCLLDSSSCQKSWYSFSQLITEQQDPAACSTAVPAKKQQIFLHRTNHLNRRIQLPTRRLFLPKSRCTQQLTWTAGSTCPLDSCFCQRADFMHTATHSPEQQDPLAACSTAVPATTEDIPAHKFSYFSYSKNVTYTV